MSDRANFLRQLKAKEDEISELEAELEHARGEYDDMLQEGKDNDWLDEFGCELEDSDNE